MSLRLKIIEDSFPAVSPGACSKIVRRSRLWVSLCLRSLRTACLLYNIERVPNRTLDQIVDPPCASVHEESHAGADCGLPCASEHGRLHGNLIRFPDGRLCDVLVPHINHVGLLIIPPKRAVYTGKVFTVKFASSP